MTIHRSAWEAAERRVAQEAPRLPLQFQRMDKKAAEVACLMSSRGVTMWMGAGREARELDGGRTATLFVRAARRLGELAAGREIPRRDWGEFRGMVDSVLRWRKLGRPVQIRPQSYALLLRYGRE